ncbi:DBH-like monooxygenase protein 1 [Plakobranchus ocellatus]|uniref:DBH-like monooxygenase protein 1 n=1 Tax=Plakobranchus ocellatus TaxID=259542 RepID=A0AAV4AG54_9GAST|nr:DBH-like monooxygenase protein 1 [Plakobranchus ocellatus]
MGQEVGNYTVMKVVRLLDTCDDEDVAVTEGTTRLIYAYSSADPPSGDSISYHGSTRGTKSFFLLDPPSQDQEKITLPSDVKTLEFTNRNRGHETLLHHVILWFCQGGLDEQTLGEDAFSCYGTKPPQADTCSHVFVAWAIGGQAFNYPSHVGYSLGSVGDPGYFMMETHYDNPNMRAAEYGGTDIFGVIHRQNWLDAKAHQNFKKMIESSPHGQLCHGSQGLLKANLAAFETPEIKQPYSAPPMCPA